MMTEELDQPDLDRIPAVMSIHRQQILRFHADKYQLADEDAAQVECELHALLMCDADA